MKKGKCVNPKSIQKYTNLQTTKSLEKNDPLTPVSHKNHRKQ